ncbi:hypothetical protein ACFODZ_16290 [Marinicella sediminis]|uniref:Uncharacterized protein n=1 Tax=Marinicella sediminis TaxID=1792834 RepID=A0ABV7JCG2_9GAMM|nr:hypothetical protein [Marinicella sediminis]
MKKALFISLSLMATPLLANNPEPVIYGTVTKPNGETITGTLRWGNQESFLSDIFNGRKVKTVGIEHLSKDEVSRLEDHQPGPQANFGEIQVTFKSFFGKDIEEPYFNVRFGDLKSLTYESNSGLFFAKLHDDTTIISYQNTNDLTDEVNILTPEGDRYEFDLEDLKSVTFEAAPENAKSFDQAIYGTVTSEIGTFQGRIMWDKDERMISEKLDGIENDKEYEIKFAEIKSIERKDNQSWVVLNDGKNLLLGGTNDVNNGNRGIWIDHPNYGRLEIKWDQFEKFEAGEVDVDWLTFADYQQNAEPLSGEVTLVDGSILKADAMAYDLNQQSGAEFLYVEVNNANRQIPFYLVKKLVKREDQAAVVTLHDGSEFVAYGERAVNVDNNGILLTQGKQHRWVEWKDVKQVTFNH